MRDTMDRTHRRFQHATLALFLLALAIPATATEVPTPASPPPGKALKPLKVFILAGQSNMQGHARISTFDSMADDRKTAPLLTEMRGLDGKPRVCERAWISW